MDQPGTTGKYPATPSVMGNGDGLAALQYQEVYLPAEDATPIWYRVS